MLYGEKIIETISVGSLGLIPLKNCTGLRDKVNAYLADRRRKRESEHKPTIAFSEYQRDSYIINAITPRFGSDEGKGLILESIRRDNLYIMVDICNYNLAYSLFGVTNHMSPGDHFQDLKRMIAAAASKAHKISVIMPFLYGDRQHKRSGRESLDCALALKELANVGVENVVAFDTHNPRVQDAIPFRGFKTVQPIYQFLKYLLRNETDLQIGSGHMMVINPDGGDTGRAVYFTNVLGLDTGMFYKRRDYTRVASDRNPTVAHEFLGTSMENKDVLIIDGMVSSGESVLDVAKELKRRKARRVFICATLGLLTSGLTKFDKYYEKSTIDRILTINLVYQTLSLFKRPYYIDVDMSKYITLIIDNLNHDASLSNLLIPTKRINRLLAQYHSQVSSVGAVDDTAQYVFGPYYSQMIQRPFSGNEGCKVPGNSLSFSGAYIVFDRSFPDIHLCGWFPAGRIQIDSTYTPCTPHKFMYNRQKPISQIWVSRDFW